ncbi:Levodione reductase [Thalassocella blandensis]|nr:Levodione reductase [Thalassocella blandensis]
MHTPFKDQVIFISGAASGFGKLLAQQLAAQHAKLVLADRNEEGLHLLKEELSTINQQGLYRKCDVTKEEEVKSLMADAIATFDRLDIAINNAGMSTIMKPLIETEEQDLDLNFAVNTKGVFFAMKYQIPPMIKQGGGSILNVSSMAGIGGAPKLAAYSASKHAVIGLTKTAAVEYARHKVRVNAICPFYSLTPILENEPKQVLDMFASGCPMKRLGEPEEIVAAMLSIIAPENSYMNGQAIAVDGGVSAY